MSSILLTGFKPFLGDKTNPSELICREIKNPNVTTKILPVEFEKAFLDLQIEVQQNEFDYIIMLGLGTGSTRLRLEKVGMNWNESTHADESGYLVPVGPIDTSAPLSLMTSFPINDIFQKLNTQNYPVDISFSAGSFVCNSLYYKTLRHFPNIKSIFIHVPSENIIRIQWQVEVIQEILKKI